MNYYVVKRTRRDVCDSDEKVAECVNHFMIARAHTISRGSLIYTFTQFNAR